MGYIEGLLGGFTGRKSEVEKENLRQADLASQRETAILSHLMNSDDPEIRSAAVTGLLDSASPKKRKGGLAGWMGEMQEHPAYGRVRTLMETPVTETQVTPGAAAPRTPLPPSNQLPGHSDVPDGPIQSQIVAPPAGAGMPQQSPVTGGAPPAPSGYAQPAAAPPPTPRFVEQAPTVTTTSHPRQVFASREEQAYTHEIGQVRAEVAGDKMRVAAGLPPRYGSQALRANQGQHVAIELPDGTQRMATFKGGVYVDPDTGHPFEGAMPLQRTASSSMGIAIETLAKSIYGKRGVQLTQPEMATLLEVQQLQKEQMTPTQALSHAERLHPNGTIEQKYAIADALMQGTHVSPGAQGGPPAPASAVPPAGGTAPVTPAPAAGAPPAPGGRLGAPPSGMAEVTNQTGKPIPQAVAQTLAKAKSTNDLIDQALAALEPFKEDGTLEGSIKLAEGYRHGEYSNVYSAAAQLADLAGIQSKSQAQLGAGASRAARFMVERSQHVPRLPSGRQAMASHIPLVGAKGVERGSELLKGDEGGFDTPQMMYQKLVAAKANNSNYIKEIESSVREPLTTGGPPTPGAAGGTEATAKPGDFYKDASGVWRQKQQ